MTQDGIAITTNSADFTFSVTPKPKNKEVVLVFRAPSIVAPFQPSAQKNAVNASQINQPFNATAVSPSTLNTPAVNASKGNMTTAVLQAKIVPTSAAGSSTEAVINRTLSELNEPPLMSTNLGSFALRTKITRPEQSSEILSTDLDPAEAFRMRQPISRESLTSLQNASSAAGSDSVEVSWNASAPIAETAAMPGRNATREKNYTQNGTDVPDDSLAIVTPETYAAQDTTLLNSTNATEPVNAIAENATADNLSSNSSSQDQQVQHEYFAAFQNARASGDEAAAKRAMVPLLRANTSAAMREAVLYGWADLLMQVSRGNPGASFRAIEGAYLMAMNNDVSSPRVPEVLHDLGYLHLSVENIQEARAYFGLLRKRYPEDSRIPMIDMYWGQYYAERGDCHKAADHFQFVTQNYPQSDWPYPVPWGYLNASVS